MANLKKIALASAAAVTLGAGVLAYMGSETFKPIVNDEDHNTRIYVNNKGSKIKVEREFPEGSWVMPWTDRESYEFVRTSKAPVNSVSDIRARDYELAQFNETPSVISFLIPGDNSFSQKVARKNSKHVADLEVIANQQATGRAIIDEYMEAKTQAPQAKAASTPASTPTPTPVPTATPYSGSQPSVSDLPKNSVQLPVSYQQLRNAMEYVKRNGTQNKVCSDVVYAVEAPVCQSGIGCEVSIDSNTFGFLNRVVAGSGKNKTVDMNMVFVDENGIRTYGMHFDRNNLGKTLGALADLAVQKGCSLKEADIANYKTAPDAKVVSDVTANLKSLDALSLMQGYGQK